MHKHLILTCVRCSEKKERPHLCLTLPDSAGLCLLQQAVAKQRGGSGAEPPVGKGGRVAAKQKKSPGCRRHSGLKGGGNLLSHLV